MKNKEFKIIKKSRGKKSGPAYRYELWVDGSFVHARKTDREYNWGAVWWNEYEDYGQFRMEMMRKNHDQFPAYVFADYDRGKVHIVEVTHGEEGS